MPTKQTIKVTKTKNKKRARLAFSIDFDVDDPHAQRVYAGLAAFVREAMTEDERIEFMRLFEIERAKLAA